VKLYAMDDRPDAPSKAAVEVTEEQAFALNNPRDCRGVFWTVNEFNGPRRKECLRRIRAWAVDIDDGTKAAQHANLHSSPLVPSLIVETKRGYQAYWNAADGQAEHWNAIVLERLVPRFGADRNARDLCRILRAPGFLHLKDPADPFRVRVVWEHRVTYTERQIGEAFPWVCSTQHHVDEARAEVRAAIPGAAPSGDEFWQAVASLDCREALERFSGSPLCRGEHFTFRRVSSGNLNIFCDGKGTSCWVDASGKIGSSDKGGPFISSWLRWYGNDWPTVIAALKAAYPHLAEIDERGRAAWREHRRAERRAA
jgi:hypothetical protein